MEKIKPLKPTNLRIDTEIIPRLKKLKLATIQSLKSY